MSCLWQVSNNIEDDNTNRVTDGHIEWARVVLSIGIFFADNTQYLPPVFSFLLLLFSYFLTFEIFLFVRPFRRLHRKSGSSRLYFL